MPDLVCVATELLPECEPCRCSCPASPVRWSAALEPAHCSCALSFCALRASRCVRMPHLVCVATELNASPAAASALPAQLEGPMLCSLLAAAVRCPPSAALSHSRSLAKHRSLTWSAWPQSCCQNASPAAAAVSLLTAPPGACILRVRCWPTVTLSQMQTPKERLTWSAQLQSCRQKVSSAAAPVQLAVLVQL